MILYDKLVKDYINHNGSRIIVELVDNGILFSAIETRSGDGVYIKYELLDDLIDDVENFLIDLKNIKSPANKQIKGIHYVI